MPRVLSRRAFLTHAPLGAIAAPWVMSSGRGTANRTSIAAENQRRGTDDWIIRNAAARHKSRLTVRVTQAGK